MIGSNKENGDCNGDLFTDIQVLGFRLCMYLRRRGSASTTVELMPPPSAPVSTNVLIDVPRILVSTVHFVSPGVFRPAGAPGDNPLAPEKPLRVLGN